MFTPSSSGSITPNNQMGEHTINMNINAIDPKGIDQLLYERRADIKNLVRKAIQEGGGGWARFHWGNN